MPSPTRPTRAKSALPLVTSASADRARARCPRTPHPTGAPGASPGTRARARTRTRRAASPAACSGWRRHHGTGQRCFEQAQDRVDGAREQREHQDDDDLFGQRAPVAGRGVGASRPRSRSRARPSSERSTRSIRLTVRIAAPWARGSSTLRLPRRGSIDGHSRRSRPGRSGRARSAAGPRCSRGSRCRARRRDRPRPRRAGRLQPRRRHGALRAGRPTRCGWAPGRSASTRARPRQYGTDSGSSDAGT